MSDDTSEFVEHIPCGNCGSSDANSLYTDGHQFCFACDTHVPGDGQTHSTSNRKPRMSQDLLPTGTIQALASRGIHEATCRHYGYSVTQMKGAKVHAAPYHNQAGTIVAQHIRAAGKQFPWIGDKAKDLQLFGQAKARDGAQKIIVTEGEIDAMSVHQIINSGRKSYWAVVSVGSGAKGAKRDLQQNITWLEKADEIVLMFDNDEPGLEAAAECARLFRPGKCKIASLPLKDANDMLRANRGAEVVDAIYSAKEWRPEGIVSLADVREEALKVPTLGLPWWLDALNDDNYGRQYGELVGIGAGTGVGKTDFTSQQVVFDITELDLKVGIFFLEQQPYESAQRMAGKLAGKPFHIPPDKCNPPWETHELAEALDQLGANDNLRMLDHFGVAEYDRIEENIRHLYHAEGTRIFYIDHLTALAAQADNEKEELERIMSCLGGLVKELPIWIGYISHLTTPEGKPHEEGGRVMIRHFKGSRSIGFWSHRMYGLERNQQADDPEIAHTTTLRCLKDRPVGSANGKTYKMGYDEKTGRLFHKTDDDDFEAFSSDSEEEPF